MAVAPRIGWLRLVMGFRRNLIGGIGRCTLSSSSTLAASSSSFSAVGGWRIPKNSCDGAASSSSPVSDKEAAVKCVQVHIPDDTIKPLQLCFKQRFTVPPGGASTGRNSVPLANQQTARIGDDDDDMTGTRVWPSASKLLSRLCLDQDLCLLHHQRDNNKPPLRILELGSGCGLLGLSLAALGHYVLLTDHEGNIKWLQENVQLNKHLIDSRAKTAVLGWGSDTDADAIEKELVGDDESFDLIVGSDLIYDSNCHHALVDTMRRFALRRPTSERKGEGGLVALGYPDRGSSESHFLHLAKDYFDIHLSPMEGSGENKSAMVYALCRFVGDSKCRATNPDPRLL